MRYNKARSSGYQRPFSEKQRTGAKSSRFPPAPGPLALPMSTYKTSDGGHQHHRASSQQMDKISNCHLHLDGFVRQVALHFEVRIRERVDVGFGRLDQQRGERSRLPAELLLQRVDVVDVHVRVTDCVYELTRLEPARLRNQIRRGGNQDRVQGTSLENKLPSTASAPH